MRRWSVLGILTYKEYVPVPVRLRPSLTAARYKSSHPLSLASEGEALAQPQSLSSAEGRVSEYQFLPKGRGLVYLWECLNRQSEAGAKAARPLSRLMWVNPGQSAPQPRELAAVEGGRLTELPLSPGRIYAYDSQRDQLELWVGRKEQLGGPEYSSLQWKRFDEREIFGPHVAPPGRFTGPRLAYISIHGGPSSQSRPGYLSGVLRQLVEELGMHVILPNVRGSDGFGQRFLNLDKGLRREDSVKDISALVDLIATCADMDAAQVGKPLFVVHGRNDPRVPYGEAQQMVAAVRATGTPVWFLSAADEGHSFTKASNRAYLNVAMLDFVRRIPERCLAPDA